MTQGATPLHLQHLPSAAARFCLALDRFCREDLELDLTGAGIVVAYSGGADSRALLLALGYLAPRLSLRLHAAILNHGIRPEAAFEVDEARNLCERYGIPLHTDLCDVPAFASASGVGLEEAGRLCRETFLEAIRKKTRSRWIAVGHQLNDLAEDSLMRMLRGAGWPALGGMAAHVPEKYILRPLLLVPRTAIELFLLQVGESWHDDTMNTDDAYLRNRVRKRLLPEFLKENPAFLDSVAARWHMARRDAAHFTLALRTLVAEPLHGGVFLSRSALEQHSAAIRSRKYKEILDALGPGQVLAVHVKSLETLWQRNAGGRVVQFPGGKNAMIFQGGILFRKNGDSPPAH